MLLSRLRRGISSVLSLFLPLALCAGLLLWPETAALAAREGLSLCGSLLIPALFPFFVLSGMTVSLGASSLLGRLAAPLMGPLFHQGGAGASALALGLIGGYPVGARTVCDLYREGLCGRVQAERLLTFCNNCGPAFVVGAAGIGVFQSAKTGLILMAIQVLSACCTGALLRPERQAISPPVPSGTSKGLADCLTASIAQAAAGVLNVCAYVIFFNVLIRLLDRSGLMELWAGALPCPMPWRRSLVTGFLELSNGIASLPGTPEAIIPISFLLSWGGLSVHCQTLSLLRGEGLGAGWYFAGKLTQACIAAALACLSLRLFPAALTAAGTAGDSLPLPWPIFSARLVRRLATLLWMGTAAVIALGHRKRAGNQQGRRV